jgi:DNA-binding GntR family transcriptional regulator
MKAIKRKPIRDQVYERLLERIFTGEFAPGTRLKDTEVAAMIGVSRTPVRESLLQLTHEGFLTNPPGRGFTVSELDPAEVRDTYPILAALEELAIGLGGCRTEATRKKLAELNARMEKSSGDPVAIIEIDSEWHRTLVSDCPNAGLLKLIEQQRRILRRYEFAYMHLVEDISGSVADHTAILQKLEEGDHATAGTFARTHWVRSLTCLESAWPD